MRGLLMVGALVLGAASPAAANWGYYNGDAAGYANAGYANYGGGYGYGYASYGYGYGNLSQHGAGLPHWGDCPCCAGAWDGYCEERAARAANRHCNGGACGQRHFGRRCSAKGCDTCGASGDCGCANGTAVEAAPAVEAPVTPPPPTPDAAPAAAAKAAPVGRSA